MAASSPDDLRAWRECRDCGLVQRVPPLHEGESAQCARCGAELRRAWPRSIAFARACTAVSTVLFLLALGLPLVTLQVVGRRATSTLFSGPRMLAEHGLPGLAAAVLLTLVVIPAVKLAIELAVFFGAALRRPPPLLAWTFAWLDRVSPWAMVEVYLLGAFVAYTRLRALAHVEVGSSIVALGGVMLASVATEAVLDREALWRALERGRCDDDRSATPGAQLCLLGCRACGRVARAAEGERCRRCRHRLVARDTGRLGRVWALVVGAVLLYVPANVLPVMTVERFGKGGPTTILHGVVELFDSGTWPLAIIVLLASVVVPMVKLASLAVMLVAVHRGSDRRLRARTRLYRFVQAIGRWSMIDVFMLATLVGVVQLGFLATVLPGMGAGAFCAVVVLTMIATETFDPRWMWDAAGQRGDAPLAAGSDTP